MVNIYAALGVLTVLIFYFVSTGKTNSVFLWFLLALSDLVLTLHFLKLDLSLFALLYGTGAMFMLVFFSQYYRMLNKLEKTNPFRFSVHSFVFICLLGLALFFQFSEIRPVYGPLPAISSLPVEDSKTWLVVELLFYFAISLSTVWGLRTYWLRQEELHETS